MQKEYELNGKKYKLEQDEHNIFNYDEIKDLVTDYFENYDYIFGDIAYNKVRLKGFCEKNNKKLNKTNNIEKLDDYIKKYCAYKCKWFLLKKVK